MLVIVVLLLSYLLMVSSLTERLIKPHRPLLSPASSTTSRTTLNKLRERLKKGHYKIAKDEMTRISSSPPDDTQFDNPIDDPIYAVLETMVQAADDRKAKHMRALYLANCGNIASFLVVVEASSKPQSEAIAAAIEDAVKDRHSISLTSRDGRGGSGWIAMDFDSVLVHIMTPQVRRFYDLEGNFPKAKAVDLSTILTSHRAKSIAHQEQEIAQHSSSSPSLSIPVVRDITDPFWA